MNETTILVIATIVGTLVGTCGGTYFGYLLSNKAAKELAERIEQRDRRSVRLLLRTEIQSNVSKLRDYWQPMIRNVNVPYQETVAQFRVDQFAQVSLPHWSHLMWESQAALVRMALEANELQHIFAFHAKLDELSAAWREMSTVRHDYLVRLREAQQQSNNNPQVHQEIIEEFQDEAQILWTAFERVVSELLDSDTLLQAEPATFVATNRTNWLLAAFIALSGLLIGFGFGLTVSFEHTFLLNSSLTHAARLSVTVLY